MAQKHYFNGLQKNRSDFVRFRVNIVVLGPLRFGIQPNPHKCVFYVKDRVVCQRLALAFTLLTFIWSNSHKTFLANIMHNKLFKKILLCDNYFTFFLAKYYSTVIKIAPKSYLNYVHSYTSLFVTHSIL